MKYDKKTNEFTINHLEVSMAHRALSTMLENELGYYKDMIQTCEDEGEVVLSCQEFDELLKLILVYKRWVAPIQESNFAQAAHTPTPTMNTVFTEKITVRDVVLLMGDDVDIEIVFQDEDDVAYTGRVGDIPWGLYKDYVVAHVFPVMDEKDGKEIPELHLEITHEEKKNEK